MEAEAAHFAKTNGGSGVQQPSDSSNNASAKRLLEAGPGEDEEAEEDIETKRRRVLEATRDIDADSDGSESDSSDEERYVREAGDPSCSANGDLGSDEEDEQAELLRELEKIKRERAEQREREVG